MHTSLPIHNQACFAVGNAIKSPGFVSVTDVTGQSYDKDSRKEFWGALAKHPQMTVSGNNLTIKLSF